MKINWYSEESHLILNPKTTGDEREKFDSCFHRSPLLSHVWVASSGSQSKKLIALSKEAIMISAEAVNQHLRSTSADKWGVCLPRYHVGGLTIEARAMLSGARVAQFTKAWDAKAFHRFLNEEKITLTSLVPTQLFDLVQAGVQAPVVLRAAIIGGSALDEDLYYKARKLGWPLLPSFGMTEMASQIATATLSSVEGSIFPKLRLLNHVEARKNAEGILEVKSKALMTGYWEIEKREFHAVDAGSWYTTEDIVQVEDRDLFPIGRSSDFVKIKGEGMYLSQIETRIRSITHLDGTLVALKDARDGYRLVWVVEGNADRAKATINKWNQSAFPLERISEVQMVEKVPTGALGKLQRQKLSQLLKS